MNGIRFILSGILMIPLLIAIGILFFTLSDSTPVPQESGPLPFPKVNATITDTAYVDGFFFMAPFKMTGNAAKTKGTLMIVDAKGAIVWTKPDIPSSNFQLQPNGQMSYFSNSTKQYFLMNERFEVVDSLKCVNGSETDAHEFMILPNRHYLVLGIYEREEDHSDFAIEKPIRWRGGKKMKVRYNTIQEFNEKKKFLYEWTSFTHFRIEDIDPVFLTDTGKADIPHVNAFDVDENGNFLVTARYTNEVAYVDRTTGKPIWILGGNRSTFAIADSNYVPFIGQHAAHFLPNGNVLLYDNGWALTDKIHPSTGLEFSLDHTAKAAAVNWSCLYNDKLIAESTGNIQRLENGGTLISFGKIFEATPNVLCAVVDETGKPHFELVLPDTMGTYRTYFYPELPFEIQRAVMDVEMDDGKIVLRTRDDLEHLWSTGQTAAAITISEPGTYQWFRRNEDGSFTGSNSIRITREMLTRAQK